MAIYRKPWVRIGLPLVVLVCLVGGILAATRQDQLPNIEAATALPTIGTAVYLYDSSGKPSIEFVATDYVAPARPYDTLDLTYTFFRLTIRNVGNQSFHAGLYSSVSLIDSWGANRRPVAVNDAGEIGGEATFDLEPGDTRSTRLRIDLPDTAQPNLLIWSSSSQFVVLSVLSGVMPAVGDDLLASAKPAYSSSWIAVPAGTISVNQVDSDAETEKRGVRFWDEDKQFASVTFSFSNTQSGPYFWEPETVSIVDQLGRAYTRWTSVNDIPGDFLDRPAGLQSLDVPLVPAGTTVTMTMGFAVPLGTQIRYVLVNAGSTSLIVTNGHTDGDSNGPYNDSLVLMFERAASNCFWYGEWSGRIHPVLDRLSTILNGGWDYLATLTAADYRAMALELRSLGESVSKDDTYEQMGFSESVWLQSVLTQAADELDNAAEVLEIDPTRSDALAATTVLDLIGKRDQFQTRLASLDQFFISACGDFGATPEAAPLASPLATPIATN